MDHHQPTRPAPRNRASLIVLIVLAFLLMVAAIVLVVSLPEDEAWQVSTETTAGQDVEGVGFACEGIEAQQIYPFGSGVMKLNNNRIALLDIQGAEKYTADIEFTAPFCVQTDQYFLAADRDGHGYVMLDANGECYRGSLAGRISGASISPDGYLALVQDQSDSTGMVSLFAPQTGTLLYDCYFSESGYVLSVSFSTSGDCFDVALVNTAASAARPIISRYDLSGKQLGQLRPDLTKIYPVIKYDDGQHPVLAGASGLIALSYEKGPIVWKHDFNQVVAVETATSGILVLASEKQDGRCSLYRLDAEGNSTEGIVIGDSITNLDIWDKLAAMGSGTRVIVVDHDSDEIILDEDMKAEVIRVGFSDKNTLTVVTRTGVKRLILSN